MGHDIQVTDEHFKRGANQGIGAISGEQNPVALSRSNWRKLLPMAAYAKRNGCMLEHAAVQNGR